MIIVAKVNIRKGEPLEKALRVFKKMITQEGTLKKLREKNYYEKPSERKKRKAKETKKR